MRSNFALRVEEPTTMMIVATFSNLIRHPTSGRKKFYDHKRSGFVLLTISSFLTFLAEQRRIEN